VDDSAGRRALTERAPRAPLVPPDLEATLVLLRHGESTAIVEGRFQGQLDTPLSPDGRRQAALAARRLARPGATPALAIPNRAPVEIVHSPLKRTTETAEAVATAMSADGGFGRPMSLRADGSFAEIAQGEWEGRPATEIIERWGALLDAWHADPTTAWAPGGESLVQVARRTTHGLATAIETLRAVARPDARAESQLVSRGREVEGPWSLVVGHDGVFKVVYLALFGLPLDRFWTFPFALCGLSIVELGDGRARLRAHNLTDHLAPLLEEQAQDVSEERERLGAL
jgi:phosphoserine phosphatase